VLRAKANDKDDPTVEPHWGRVGKQTIEDTGPLNRKRMETIDDETTAAAIEFMTRQVRANKPFFTWMNATRMHVFTHVRQTMRDQAGMPGNEYADGMIEHDGDIGKLLKAVDDLGIANNTIVIYSTDNGPNQFSWPDAVTTPFRSEKDTNWEGAFRVPAMVRWPGHIQPGKISPGMFSGLDWFPTLLGAAGDTTIKDRLLKGTDISDTTFKVHLDGYNQLDYITGNADLICSRQVSRLVARLRYADLVEQCPFAGLHRKTFAQAEFFSVWPISDLSGKPRFVSFHQAPCSHRYKRNHFFPRLKSCGSAAGPI
jgi:arylsulfatase A-like enzyme